LRFSLLSAPQVSFKDPREGELIAHRNKADRHVRILADRNAAHERAFDKLLEDCKARCQAFEKTMEDYMEVLPSQASLAAFQGVDMRCKRVMTAFRPQCEEDVVKLQAYVTMEPTKLLNSNFELLRTCKLFVEGGDYDQKEIDLLKNKLDRPTKAIEATILARQEKIKEILDTQVG
jgi:hypothetical protein